MPLIDTERNLLDVLDKVQEISNETVDPTHVFTLSQVYGGLLLKMGEKGNDATGDQLELLRERTFYGHEKENLVYPIALANLVLHGIDQPNLCHGNTLTGQEVYGGLFQNAPPLYDVVLMNPPFGGKEGKDAQTRFAYKTGATQVLFLQHVIDSLKTGGRCAIVLDEGVLFTQKEKYFAPVFSTTPTPPRRASRRTPAILKSE